MNILYLLVPFVYISMFNSFNTRSVLEFNKQSFCSKAERHFYLSIATFDSVIAYVPTYCVDLAVM